MITNKIPRLWTDYLYYFNDKVATLKTGKIKYHVTFKIIKIVRP